MLRSISVSRAALAALTLLGLGAPPSDHVHHLSTRQRPAGPANMLPEVLDKYGDLSKYFSLLKVCGSSGPKPTFNNPWGERTQLTTTTTTTTTTTEI